jgi:uncharacterized glyoxalase superfamily metalloenzyme YdcJ
MTTVSNNDLRKQFAAAMSTMYQQEVPLYGSLKDLVESINSDELDNNRELADQLMATRGLTRLAEERHGAIRLGTAKELSIIRRLFAVMGMSPVGYYDLSVAGIPVHSTAFRPLSHDDLSINAFRVFTSLLRLDLIKDKFLCKKVKEVLSLRNICSSRLLALISQFESSGDFTQSDANTFIEEALDVFRWHQEAAVDAALYQELLQQHPLIADVVSFKGPHINHLTPATLNIDRAQREMPQRGISAKAVIEGPPKRCCPILLRQTSFKALSEKVVFPATKDNKGEISEEHESALRAHTARFGEIEQRGLALTPKGQALYDRLLCQTRTRIIPDGDGNNAEQYNAILSEEFTVFPDDYPTIRQQGLAYFYFSVEGKLINKPMDHQHGIDSLIESGHVRFDPILYEDFLPVSAAGIFQSNLGVESAGAITGLSRQDEFERALGVTVENIFEHYEEIQKKSIEECLGFFVAGEPM